MNIHRFHICFVNFFCGQRRNMQQESQFCEGILRVSPRTRPCCKEYMCSPKMFWMQPVNGIHDQVCDFPCCSQIKCIRAICGTRVGQPQPRLVLRYFVLSWFKIKPTSANATTNSSSKYAACCDDVAKPKMSCANLRSSKGLPPSSKSIPSVLTGILHLLRAHSNTEQNSLPCLTPRRMSNSRLFPLSVNTCPR